MQISDLLMLFYWCFFPSALLVLLQDSLLATASSPKFSELVMKVKLKEFDLFQRCKTLLKCGERGVGTKTQIQINQKYSWFLLSLPPSQLRPKPFLTSNNEKEELFCKYITNSSRIKRSFICFGGRDNYNPINILVSLIEILQMYISITL